MNQWKRLFEELEVLQKDTEEYRGLMTGKEDFLIPAKEDDILNDLARFKMIFAEIKKEREGNK